MKKIWLIMTITSAIILASTLSFAAGSWSTPEFKTGFGPFTSKGVLIGLSSTFTADHSDGSVPNWSYDDDTTGLGRLVGIMTDCQFKPGSTAPSSGTVIKIFNKYQNTATETPIASYTYTDKGGFCGMLSPAAVGNDLVITVTQGGTPVIDATGTVILNGLFEK